MCASRSIKKKFHFPLTTLTCAPRGRKTRCRAQASFPRRTNVRPQRSGTTSCVEVVRGFARARGVICFEESRSASAPFVQIQKKVRQQGKREGKTLLPQECGFCAAFRLSVPNLADLSGQSLIGDPVRSRLSIRFAAGDFRRNT